MHNKGIFVSPLTALQHALNCKQPLHSIQNLLSMQAFTHFKEYSFNKRLT